MVQTAVQQANLYINGEWVSAPGGKTFDVTNPATGEVIGQVADGSREDAKRAIAAAEAALPAWRAMTAEQRADLLTAAFRRINEKVDEIARVLTSENGKPLTEAKGETGGGAKFLLWAAEEAKRIYGRTVPSSSPTTRFMVIKQPVGVVGAITPWNFPFSMLTRKLGPALAAGCTAVLRPAKYTPLTAVELFKIFDEVGFPKGVVNLVTSSSASTIGDEFIENPAVRKITFTGSTEVGKQIMARAAGQVKRVSMELGGHAPFIVFDDADLEKAARAAIWTKFRNAGQTCVCTNRLYVQRSVVDRFSQRVAELAGAMKVGNGLEAGVEIGPMIDRQGFEKTVEHIHDAVTKGARVLAGGQPAQVGGNGHGNGHGVYFHQPTVLADVTSSMAITHEETFGPVLPIITFDTEEEVIGLANNTQYGLAAYFFARDIGRVFRVAEALEYGIIGANEQYPVAAQVPFGGYKESGVSRENGSEGVDAFLETKTIGIGL
ncbi:MAG: NAD-dependent succinate-semialdehyde dehydrogenase [Chloroflexi bacterium]|nr:NAD-dependent succinate-semialdehyde dehydrogenase [Chloroflexota bacterium]